MVSWEPVSALVAAKYNFAVFAVALFLAGCTIPLYRQQLLHPRLLVSLLVAAVLIAPHAWWGWENRLEIMDSLSTRTGLGAVPGTRSLLRGLGGFLLSLAVGLSIPAGAVFFVSCRSLGQWLRPMGQAEPYRLLMAFVLITLASYLALVVAGGVKVFRVHWFAPLLLLVPFWFLQRGLVSPAQQRVYFALVVAYRWRSSGAGRAFFQDYEAGRYQSRDHLYAALADELTSQGHDPQVVFTQDILTAVTLACTFPRRQCTACATCLGRRWTIPGPMPSSFGTTPPAMPRLPPCSPSGKNASATRSASAPPSSSTLRDTRGTRTTHLDMALIHRDEFAAW